MHEDLNRRELLIAGTGAAAASGLFPLTAVAAKARRDPLARAGAFASGVASGVPAADGALLWTRLDSQSGPGVRLRYEVAADRDFKRVVARGEARAVTLRDGTARTRVKGLKADSEYFYRFQTRSTESRVGRFKTLPPADSGRPIRIAFFSCQRFEHGYFTSQAGIAGDEDLDVVLSLGDYLYEEDATPINKERFEPNGGVNRNTETLEQFRGRHRSYRSDVALQDMHANHALIPIWDDTEIEGNWAGDKPSSGPTPVDGRSIPFTQKRANGINAFFEWMPVDRIRGADRYRIYRSVTLGRRAELLMLDTRQYRDPQPCGDRDFTGGPCFGEAEQPRNRLGAMQKTWLQDRLTGSQATWKILGNAQMLMALDIVPGQPTQYDDWNGYAAERRSLLEHVRGRGVKNLTSVVGDVHVFFAGDLYTTGRIDGQRVGTEFVGASVSHNALNLPALSKEQSDLITEQLPLANPHLKYAEFSTHGYAVMEAGADDLKVDFVGVRSITTPTSETFKVASFRVADGVPKVERV